MKVMYKCEICGNKNVEKITIKVKVENGYVELCNMHLCKSCMKEERNIHKLFKNKIKIKYRE